MSKPIVRAACGLLTLLIVIAGLVSCGPMSEPDYANEIAESALQSLSACDYAAHMALFSPEIQSAITEAEFDVICQQTKDVIGDYIDKEFLRAENEKGYTVVDYKADFSEEPDGVTFSIYFEEIDGEMYIVGFWPDSPKLSELRGE